MNLFNITDADIISKTTLSRKLTLGGETKAYPVYKIRLDQLYYNDQNDRIATWITQYKNDISNVSFESLDKEKYNAIIQQFIIDSNPAAIEKTKNNINIVGQREPGVVLADGRIIDGNRRFTCLRLLAAESDEPMYFETVILDASAEHDQKKIKMLELAIQHGEEQRVDYNLIDMAIGAYHDIVETELLTIDEYISSTNETASEVKRRLATAKLIIEFLEFMNVPGQYHIAREMQVYSIFYELVPLLKRIESDDGQAELKKSVFSNTMMGTFDDQRKYIREVKSLMDSGLYSSYIKKQSIISEELIQKKTEFEITNKAELKKFVMDNESIKDELQVSMDRSVLQSKKTQTRSRPAQLLTKSIDSIMDIDTGIFDKLSEGEKEKIITKIDRLSDVARCMKEDLVGDAIFEEPKDKAEIKKETVGMPILAALCENEPIVYCSNGAFTITNLTFLLEFSLFKFNSEQPESCDVLVYFINDKNEELCSLQKITVRESENTRTTFSLKSTASELTSCYLVIKSPKDKYGEARTIRKFNIKIAFSIGFEL